TIKDSGQDIVSSHAIGKRFVGENNAVTHHIQRHIEHVLRQRVVTSTHKSECPSGKDQVDRSARAGYKHDVAFQLLQADLLRFACGGYHAHRIFHQGRVDID